MKTGVYQIRNLVNGKCYIGSCASIKGFPTRWSKHCKQLERKEHHSPKLQNAWNKHGIDIFVFEILEECDSRFCIEREQFYLDTMLFANCDDKRFDALGYNICRIAGSCLGVKRSDSTRKLMSNICSGQNNPMYNKKHSKESRRRIGYSSSVRHQGSQNPCSKLTEQDIQIIRTRIAKRETQSIIATDFGVDQSIISRIKTGRSWRHC